jgi:hypothetical protein
MSTKTKPRWQEILDEVAEQTSLEQEAAELMISGDVEVDPDSLKLHAAACKLLQADGVDPRRATYAQYAEKLSEADNADETRVRITLPLTVDSGQVHAEGVRILAVQGKTLEDVTEDELADIYAEAETRLTASRRGER